MTNGLGVNFGGLLLMAILTGLAIVLTLAMVMVSILQRRTGTSPQRVHSLAAVPSGAALLTAGFAVVALFDEAVVLAVAFALLVFTPLGTCWLYLSRHTTLSPLGLFATAGLAWGFPFLLGVTATFGGLHLATRAFDIAAAESRHLGLPWVATVIGAVIIVFGTLLIGTRFNGREPTPSSLDN